MKKFLFPVKSLSGRIQSGAPPKTCIPKRPDQKIFILSSSLPLKHIRISMSNQTATGRNRRFVTHSHHRSS